MNFPHVFEHSNGWSWMVLALDFWQECGRWQIWMLEDMFWYDVSGKGWEWWFWIIALTLLSSRMTSGFSSGGLSLRAYRCAVLSTGKSPDQTQLKKCEFALRGAVFGMTQSRHIGARNRVSTWVIASLASVASCFIFFSAHGRLACRYAHIQADQCTELNPTSKNTSEPADEPKTCGQCWQMFPGIMRHDEICDLRSRRSFQVFKAKLQSSHSHGIPHTLILTWSTEHTYAEEKIRKTWRLTLSWHWSGEMNLPYEMHEQDDRMTHDETIH